MRGGIIIEGAEQQGKSTFCKKLVDRLGLEVVHFGPPTKDFDFFGGYFKDIEERGGPFIFDRSYVSELAYGKVFSRNRINIELQERIENRFKDLGYFLVLLELNLPWVDRFETVTKEQNEKVKLAYRDVFATLKIDKFTITPNDSSLEMVVAEHKKRM
jgi:thymidylate kinase